MTLRVHVDRYVALKRHLGFKFLNNERMLRSWAAFAGLVILLYKLLSRTGVGGSEKGSRRAVPVR